MFTSRILIGVSAVNPCGTDVVTVTTAPGVAPSPEIILEIGISSDWKAPTISHSDLCLAKESACAGYF